MTDCVGGVRLLLRTLAGHRFRMTNPRRDAAAGFAFILPQYIGFLALVGGPTVAVAWFALHDWNLVYGTFQYVGLDNFLKILVDPEIGSVALATVVLTVGYVPLNLSLGMILAIAMNRAITGVGFFRTILFAPVVVSIIAWTTVWRFILAPNGILNSALEFLGVVGPNWLREDFWALFWLVIVQVFKSSGLTMVLFLSALQEIPADIKEAAIVDGAGAWAMFRRITLPLVTPFIFLATILAIIDSLKVFGLVYWLTFGGPGDTTKILSFYVYDQGFMRFEIGYGSALAIVMLVAVLGLTAAQFMLRRRWVYAEE